MRFFLILSLFLITTIFAQDEGIDEQTELIADDDIDEEDALMEDPNDEPEAEPEPEDEPVTDTTDAESDEESTESDEIAAEAEPESESEPEPEPEGFSGSSFFGGIVFAFALMALILGLWKYRQHQQQAL